ncbi:molecular chaperone DnaJ [Actinomyces minihominis]|uniref:molecular chaperone DnaJ n=1 Tax=Actinomyces minihominis TaxID=2002838 RepID=UPI000C0836B9|nr:molecular chaperone DnaJ [Actinomyces minihominis]
MTDYYELLGVSRDASTEDIRRAYRKKARELHPDYAGPESEDAFKSVSMAYEVLSDPEKRQRYDLGGGPGMGNGSAGYGGFQGGGFGFQDIFETMFSNMGGFGGGTGAPQYGRPGQDTLVAVEVSLRDVVFGATKEILVDSAMTCTTCSGSGAAPGTTPVTCVECSGTGSVTRVQNTLLGQMRVATACPRCQGQGQTIPTPCSECHGEGRVQASRSVTVEIPAGVENGTRIRLRGDGQAGTRGAPSGDLYVEVREVPDPMFARRGNDLNTSITVPMTTAALGTRFTLQTLDGDQQVDIHPGTQPGEVITIKGLGVKRLRSNSRGDLHIHVEVEVPRKLDAESKSLLEQLAALRGEARVEPVSSRSGGFFDKFRGKR